MIELIDQVVVRNAEAEAVDWFRRHLKPYDVAGSTARFRAGFAGAGRRLGAAVAELRLDETAKLRDAGLVAPQRWPVATFARAALLLHALNVLTSEQHPEFIREVYRRGDFREQAAVLQSLILLPDPGRLVSIAVDACRTNVRDVFEAIACENRYPAAYFPESSFNQLVIKAFFIGLGVTRIAGLQQRKTAELRRMAADYASERHAAGRSVPDDLDLVLR
jgi:hypothetical protein